MTRRRPKKYLDPLQTVVNRGVGVRHAFITPFTERTAHV